VRHPDNPRLICHAHRSFRLDAHHRGDGYRQLDDDASPAYFRILRERKRKIIAMLSDNDVLNDGNWRGRRSTSRLRFAKKDLKHGDVLLVF
jgi:hypothetical protein